MKTTILATLAALTASAAMAATAPTTTSTTTERVAVKRIVRTGDAAGAPEHSIAVFARAENGGDPTMQVQVLGENAQTFDLPALEVGESQHFTTTDGKTIDVTRTETGLSLTVDGKSIELPGMATAGLLAGAAGNATISVIDDEGQLLTEDHKMVVVGAPHAMWTAAAHAPVDLENLESVRSLRPEIRDEVVAALREILANPAQLGLPPMMIDIDDQTGNPADPHVVVRKVFVTRDQNEAPRPE